MSDSTEGVVVAVFDKLKGLPNTDGYTMAEVRRRAAKLLVLVVKGSGDYTPERVFIGAAVCDVREREHARGREYVIECADDKQVSPFVTVTVYWKFGERGGEVEAQLIGKAALVVAAE